ncbi:MAG TPA: hypothetical protein VGI39_36815 [Polyangiaceae bacterium]|jgi:hypothetical protein
MLGFPEPPAGIPETQRASGPVSIRFEDITQDGRLVLEALPPAVGEVIWRQLLTPDSRMLRGFRQNQALPILSRVVLEAGDGPFATSQPLQASGCYEVVHAADPSGDVERVMIDMWVDASLPIGKNYGPPPPRAGEPIRAGRFFAEHVMTRLFAPPDQRRVTRFTIDGEPVHGRARVWVPPESVGDLPPGAVSLEEHPRRDPTPIVFGLAHTDSNQHVNSLVYPRLFEEASLRRFAELGKMRPPVLSRYVEAAYRKPCFAGEEYAIVLRAFTRKGQLGTVGVFVAAKDAASPEALAEARPHCFVKMLFA